MLADNIRFVLYGVLVALLLMLYQAWEKEHIKPLPAAPVIQTTEANYVPVVSNSNVTTTAPVQIAQPTTTGKLIHIKTDVLDINIDTLGGDIVQTKLLKYPESLHSETPFLLLNDSTNTRYIAQSGLLSGTGPDTSKGQAIYTADQAEYVMAPDQNEMQVKLHWQDQNGLSVTKIFTLHRNSYEIDMAYQIDNQSKQAFDGNLYLQLMRKNNPPENKQGFMSLATYFGAAISSPEKAYEKIPFKTMSEKNLNQTIVGGWAAMIQHYFISAWIPEKNATSQYFTRVTNDGLYTVGLLGPKITANAGEKITTTAKFYAGPAITEKLESAAPGLQLTIDYGWFWFISAPILWLMKKIYGFVGNWGWSIVLVTVIIKLLFYHLSAKSYRSMSGMKKLQPKINALKERFGSDKQKLTQATLELYRKEKVNPMSGCLPILIQIPVFIALYWVLIESVELRQAPFILWIHDLSIKDPFYVLPVLMGLSMFLQQRLNPPSPDPMQAKVMMLMPVLFTALFISFPAGLMLYWFVNNTLSFAQQWYIMREMERTNKK